MVKKIKRNVKTTESTTDEIVKSSKDSDMKLAVDQIEKIINALNSFSSRILQINYFSSGIYFNPFQSRATNNIAIKNFNALFNIVVAYLTCFKELSICAESTKALVSILLSGKEKEVLESALNAVKIPEFPSSENIIKHLKDIRTEEISHRYADEISLSTLSEKDSSSRNFEEKESDLETTILPFDYEKDSAQYSDESSFDTKESKQGVNILSSFISSLLKSIQNSSNEGESL